jgi:ABC-type nitrate/sulfonate/bicarbonate transport system permease component
MAEVALDRGAGLAKREPFPLRWYHENMAAGRAALSFIAVGLIWEVLGQSGRWPLVITPLSSVFSSFGKMLASGQLQRHIMISLNEFIWGFLLAAVVGIVLGILIATSDTVHDFVDPWISALYSTPTVALAPLFIVIFGIDTPSKIAVVFLLAVFPIVINTATGIRATDNVYLEAARSFCASRNQIFTKVLIPSALPFIVAGLRLGIGRGLVGVVVGELFGARGGLGFLILTSSQVFDTAGLWVGVFVLAGTGIVSVLLLQKLERRMAPWREFEFK